MLLPVAVGVVAAQPAQLPTHFALGLAASPSDTWMPQSGIPWDYRMQYLVGGVNTGSGWETWNASGQFALYYAQASAQHGYIPLFAYYELVQSSGSCESCGEAQKDITNLNTPSVMAAYYQNFALLMQRLGPATYGGTAGYGKPAVVLVEPDFTGGYAYQATNLNQCFGFCSGQGNDPSLLKAAVSSTGVADVAGFADTYAGYVQALAHLRDLYAPSVVLGLDASMWATGDDLGLDTSPGIDATALGQQVGTFLWRTGPHELVMNDPLDRDAGQYLTLYGQNRWWDRLNSTYPNFARWEHYLQAIGAADGGKSLLLWQVPLGNQYFETENNTNGHYQDNRAEYIFSHIPELIQSGIVGVVFAASNPGNTMNTDAMGDGITNPGSFCTTAGISSGQVCNTHISSVSDDDGGYLRMMASAYYQSPIAVGAGSAPSSPTPIVTATPTQAATATPTATPVPAAYTTSATTSSSSAVPGQMETISTSVTSDQTSTVLVDLEVYGPTSIRVFQQYWDDQTLTAGQPQTYAAGWQVPAAAAAGRYAVDIGIFSPAWRKLYSWQGPAAGFTVSSAPLTSTPTSTPLPTNTPVPTATSISVAPRFSSFTTASTTR